MVPYQKQHNLEFCSWSFCMFLNSSKLRTPSPSLSYLANNSFLSSLLPADSSTSSSSASFPFLNMKWCSPRYSLLNLQMTSKLLQ